MPRPAAAPVIAVLALLAAAPAARAEVHFLGAFGSAGAGDGQLSAPAGVAADDDGHVFVADTGNGRIQRFGDDGHAELAFGAGTLSGPRGVAADHRGNVYVADTGNARIVKYTRDGTFVTSWTDATALAGVASVAVDPTGRVYAIGDAHRILRFDPSGAPTGAWGESGAGNGQFAHPRGIAAAAGGVVYGADDLNTVVQPWVLGSGPLARFGGAGTFAGPSGVALDPTTGDLLVADGPAGVVQRRTTAGALVGMIGAPGAGDGELSGPSGVAVDCRGTLFVADTMNGRIAKFGQGALSTRECFPPQARIAVGPAAPQAGQDVTFDGSGSTDEDGTIRRWDWQVQGPESFEAQNQDGPRLTRRLSHPGTYDVRLRVTDDEGNRGEQAITVTVGASADPAIAKSSGTGLARGAKRLLPFLRLSPSRLTVAAFRRSGVKVTVGGAPASVRAYTVTIRRVGKGGCTVLRRTLRPAASRRRLLSASSAGLATKLRATRASGRRCAARTGRYQVSVSFAGVRAAPATAGLELLRRRRR